MNVNDGTARAVAPEQGGGAAEEPVYRLRQQQLTAEFGHFAPHDTAALLQEATRVCALGMQSEFCKVMEYLPAAEDIGEHVDLGGLAAARRADRLRPRPPLPPWAER